MLPLLVIAGLMRNDNSLWEEGKAEIVVTPYIFADAGADRHVTKNNGTCNVFPLIYLAVFDEMD